MGTLCVLDNKPRKLTDLQRRVLEVHAKTVTRHLEFTKLLIERDVSMGRKQDGGPIPPLESELYKKTKAQFETLTPREKEVLNLIAGQSPSLSSKQIAAQLGISFRTVHHHRAHIMAKINVTSVAELIAISLKAGIYK